MPFQQKPDESYTDRSSLRKMSYFKDPIGYNPSDFFYVSALANNSSQDIEQNFCQTIYHTDPALIDASCNNLTQNDNAIDVSFCIHTGICQNQKLAQQWTNLQTNHSGSGKKLDDVQATWYVTYANSVNLILGIGLITWSCTKSLYRIVNGYPV
jgi:hypothetical protein